ncbi:hypothetical protein [Mangrovimonas sp. TPBH4]|uniref:hypothetical protein n=1 Tax=Mangrovimonas sp. TPBH4 TaxID=1645914 RepID=UPI0006B602DA|nr:hypothetical protein [Mangrovimonas sp. TPBH4]
MINYNNILDLNIEELDVLGDAYQGYANILIEENKISNLPIIASCFVIAATYKSFLNPKSSMKYFKKAAKYYLEDNNRYWIVCAMCSNDFPSNYLFKHFFISNKLTLNKLSKIEMEFFKNFFNLDSDSKIDNGRPNFAGRLNIPEKLYIDALNEIKQLTPQNLNDSSLVKFTMLFERFSEVTYSLKSDSFHWNLVLGNFIPVEPETIAFSKLVLWNLSQTKIDLEDIFKQIELNEIAKIPLNIALSFSTQR